MANTSRLVKAAATLSLLAVTLAILVPTFAGRPIVSYASSGSMEPTIGTLDGFFVNPYPASVEPGDIIVFHSFVQDGPAVHRVVGVDDEGWITRGDANERNDQDIGEPSVTRDRLLGKVIARADGTPIVVESLGVSFLEARADLVGFQEAVGGPRLFGALLFLALAALFALPTLFARKKRRLPTRLPLRVRVLLRRALPRGLLGRHVGALLFIVVVASSAFAASHARQDVVTTMIVLQDPNAADETRAAGPGGALLREIEVSSLGPMPTVVIIDGDPTAIRVARESILLGPDGTATMATWQVGGSEVGIQEDRIHIWRYPAILPEGAIAGLHRVMPGSPYFVLGAVGAALGALWFTSLRISTLPVGRTLGIKEDWL